MVAMIPAVLRIKTLNILFGGNILVGHIVKGGGAEMLLVRQFSRW